MHEFRRCGYGRYALHYHLLWCPKPGLQLAELEQGVQQIILDICRAKRYKMLSLEVQPRFIYLSLSVQPTVAPADAVRTLKSMCTVRLLQLYPELIKHYSLHGSLWKKGFLVSTARISNPEEIWRVIEE